MNAIMNSSMKPVSRDGDSPDEEMVRIDRAVPARYPKWVSKVPHRELEKKGPAEYSLGDIRLFRNQAQAYGGMILADALYWDLRKGLENHLDLRDLEAIQKLGIDVYRKYFANVRLFAWKSTVISGEDEGRYVPYIAEQRGAVVINWMSSGGTISEETPAGRFTHASFTGK